MTDGGIPSTAGLRGLAVRGVAWTTSGQIGSTILQIGAIVILAQLLTPRDFGLLGMIAVFSGFGSVFATVGFPNALIHRARIDDKHRSTALWVTLGMSLIIWIILSVTGPLIAQFYGEPRLAALLVVGTTAIPLSAFGSVHRALLSRDMQFNSLAAVDLSSISAGAGVAIALAAGGAGVWSLVAQPATVALVGSLLAWRAHKWRPKTGISRNHFRDLFVFGGHATGFAALNYWVRQGDDFLIGLRVGATALGLYSRAYAVLLMPVQNVTQVLGRVMFPVLARLQSEPERLARAYLQAANLIAVVVFPAMAGLYAVAPAFVLVVFGRKWIGMVPFVEIFAILGMGQTIGTTVGWLFQALGRMKQQLVFGLAAVPVLLTSFIVGSQWGAEGVAVAYAVTSFILLPISFRIAGRHVGLGPVAIGRHVWRPAVSAALMAFAVRIVDHALLGSIPDGARLSLQVAVGILVYLVLVAIIARPSIRDVLGALPELRSGRTAP